MKTQNHFLERQITMASLSFFLILSAFTAGLSGGTAQESKRMIQDNLGRSVPIPARADRILSLQPEITRIILALGAGDRLVGVDYFMKRDDHLFRIISPAAARLPVVSMPDESVNKELVVKLDPDVIFASPTEQQVPEAIQRSLGIPVAALASMGSFDGLLEEIEIVGTLTGQEARAGELVRYFREKIQVISRSIGSVKEEERPETYLAFWSSLVRTPVFYEPVLIAGGKNVAQNLLPSYLGSLGTVVSLEQIVEWNPDVILVHGSYLPQERQVTVEGILDDRRLGSVKAVRNRRVYYTPGFWYWWDPAGVLVETVYLAGLFHPEKFVRFDLEAEANAIFEVFYGKKSVFTALAKTLDFHGWNTEKK
jgi:iron complex transport system substrate-binding protein